MHFFVLCYKAPQVLHSYDAALTAPDLTQQVFLQCVHAPLRSAAGAADADAASLVEGVVVAAADAVVPLLLPPPPPPPPRTKLSPTLSRCRQLDTYEFRCRRTLLNEE
jgi:hypothetical protein